MLQRTLKISTLTNSDILFHPKRGNVGIELAKKAYYNLYKKDIDDAGIVEYLKENISMYSVLFDADKEKQRKYSPRGYRKSSLKFWRRIILEKMSLRVNLFRC